MLSSPVLIPHVESVLGEDRLIACPTPHTRTDGAPDLAHHLIEDLIPAVEGHRLDEIEIIKEPSPAQGRPSHPQRLAALHRPQASAGRRPDGHRRCTLGILGIGSGALKVLALDWAMRLPFKVSTTTSNFMIGVTAAASAGVYLRRGYIDPGLAMPVMLGVLAGALLGARVLARAQTRLLRWVFAMAMTILGIEMIYDGLSGGS
jgi:hypothetical protein